MNFLKRVDSILKSEKLYTTETNKKKLAKQIEDHHYFLIKAGNSSSTEESIFLWYKEIFIYFLFNYRKKVLKNILFKNKDSIELYLNVVDHWHFLKENSNCKISFLEAFKSYTRKSVRGLKKIIAVFSFEDPSFYF